LPADRQRADLGRGQRRLLAALVQDVVWTAQPGMELFLRHRRLPPTEVAGDLGPVRHGLARPEPHHALARGRVVGRPVDRPRLLLHHPERAVRADEAIEIVVEGRDVVMPGPRIEPPLLVGEPGHALVGRAERIAVPGGEIEIGHQRQMGEFGEKPHEVVGDPPARAMRPDDRRLLLVEAGDLGRGEAAPVQAMRGVGLGDREIGWVDFGETRLVL
jgi:hypothetical protein